MPLSILLLPLIIFIFIFLLFSVSAFYHLARFDLFTPASIAMTTLFIVGTLCIGIVSVIELQNIDWSARITLSDIAPFQDTTQQKNNVLRF